MGKLIDDQNLIVNNRNAANLVQTVTDLLTQETNLTAQANTLKGKIKTAVAIDNFVLNDFISFCNVSYSSVVPHLS